VEQQNVQRNVELNKAKQELAEWYATNPDNGIGHVALRFSATALNKFYGSASPLAVVYGEAFPDYSHQKLAQFPDCVIGGARLELERKSRSTILQSLLRTKAGETPDWRDMGYGMQDAVGKAGDAVTVVDEYTLNQMISPKDILERDFTYSREKNGSFNQHLIGEIIGVWGRQQSGMKGLIRFENERSGEVQSYVEAARKHLLDAGVPEERLADLTVENLVLKK